MWKKGEDTGAPEPKRPKKGDCPGCGKGVYADQPRAFENGAYYHEACLAAGAPKSKMNGSREQATPTADRTISRVKAPPDDDGARPNVPKKGDCPGCGKGVYADQPRAFEDGAYYHEACLAAGAPKSKMTDSQEQATPTADRTISRVKAQPADMLDDPSRPKKDEIEPADVAGKDLDATAMVEHMLAAIAEEQAAAVRAEALVRLKTPAGDQMLDEGEQKREETKKALEAAERKWAEAVDNARKTADDQMRQREETKRELLARIAHQQAKAKRFQSLAAHEEKGNEEEGKKAARQAQEEASCQKPEADERGPVNASGQVAKMLSGEKKTGAGGFFASLLGGGAKQKATGKPEDAAKKTAEDIQGDSAVNRAYDKLAAIELSCTRSPSAKATSLEDAAGVNGDQDAQKAAKNLENTYITEMLRAQVDSTSVCMRSLRAID